MLLGIVLIQEVGFDLRSCWDCGLHPSWAVGEVVFLFALLLFGLYLRGKGGNLRRIVGGTLIGFALVPSLLFTISAPPWVQGSTLPPDFYDERLVRTFYAVITLIQAGTVFLVNRNRRNATQRAGAGR